MFTSYWFICLLGLLAVYHLQRKIYALRNYVSTRPCLDDIWILAWVSAGIAAVAHAIPMLLPLVVTLVLVAALLLWFDALLLHLYGFEVNISNIRIFFQGAESFSGEWAVLPRTFAKRPWFLALPVTAVSGAVALWLPAQHGQFSLALTLCLTAFLFGASKSKLRPLSLLVWLVVFVGIAEMVQWLVSQWPPGGWSPWLGIGGLLSLLAIRLLPGLNNNKFLKARSDLRHFLVGERLLPVKGVTLKPEHQRLIEPEAHPLTPSRMAGTGKNANVILITLESLSREHVNSYVPGMAHMETFERLCERGLRSEAHYACSPNTNRAMEHIYRSDYPHRADYPFLPALHGAGYQSAFMMISRTRYFNLCDILSGIGFQHVWDQDSEGFAEERGDYSFIDSVEKIADTLGDQPFFLHLKSEQTHSPYLVVQEERFNRFNVDERELHYLNAIEESDHVIGMFLEQLGQRIDLANTVVVYTGDHGQSFGEFGYVSHSSATIKQQVRVPFVISHPDLSAQTVPQSTHFDLMPTVMDLLGIDIDYRCFGRSLFGMPVQRNLLLYSQTRRGNAPSNLSLMTPDEKVMLDLLYGYQYRLSLEDEVREQLSDDESAYYRTLFYHLLNARGLISQSAFNPRPKTRPD